MPTRRDALLLGGVGLAAALVGALWAPVVLQRRHGEAALAAAAYPDLTGHLSRVSDWRVPALVCNFWATWCEPCREEIPLLMAIREKYGPQRVEIVGIGIDRADKMRQYAADFRISYPLLVGDIGGLQLMTDLGNDAGALPFTVVRDRQGAIRFRHLGRLHPGDLEPILAAILQ